MATQCSSVADIIALRATRLDNCGRIQYGDFAQVVTECQTRVSASAEVDEGEAIQGKNGAGKTLVRRNAEPEITGKTLEIEFIKVDPALFELIAAVEVLYDAFTGDAVGYRERTDIRPADKFFALEGWSDVLGVPCGLTTDKPYWYNLWPFLQGGVLGDVEFAEGLVNFTVQNISAVEGAQWDVGPYEVVLNSLGEASVLTTPVTSTDVQYSLSTTVAPPPADGCGYLPLDDPNAPLATGATAGEPGFFTPVPSVRPADFTDLSTSTIVADPATAWTTGQHVILGDGDLAYWDGVNWQQGTAP